MENKKIYHLCLELSYPGGPGIEINPFRRLAYAQNGIKRDILISGETSLYTLHSIIQNIFGWNNIHLHKFSLDENTFEILTENKGAQYERLCGALFRYCSDNNSAWCWHVLFGKPLFNLPALVPEYTAADSLFVNQIYAGKTGKYNSPRIRTTAVKKYSAAPQTSDFNVLLERLRINELLLSDRDPSFTCGNNRPRLLKWRQSVINNVADAIEQICSYKACDPAGFAESYAALNELEAWKESFFALMNIRSNPAAVTSRFGCTVEEAFKKHRDMIRTCCRNAHHLIKYYNPTISPFFDSINYWYDRGDEWRIRITCRNVFIPAIQSPAGSASPDALTHEPSLLPGADRISCGSRPSFLTHENIISYGHSMDIAGWIDKNGHHIPPEAADRLNALVNGSSPICIAAEGLNVMDNIGGIQGFFDFLNTINGADELEAVRLREQAGAYGWDGHMPKVHHIGL